MLSFNEKKYLVITQYHLVDFDVSNVLRFFLRYGSVVKLKNLLFICLIALILISYQLHIVAKPPFLKNDDFSCWSDSVVWLLYNIPELVDTLIDNKASYKENSDVCNLTHLFEAMKKRE